MSLSKKLLLLLTAICAAEALRGLIVHLLQCRRPPKGLS